jgi:hypothetical protein
MKSALWCDEFAEWLKPKSYLDSEGKKLPPPCTTCSEISSRFRRANAAIKTATRVIQLAVLALSLHHKEKSRENPPATTLIVGPSPGVTQ